jgi:NAD(P)-dependent dehydrogenase (short-subunit alcohol dehydrogenase family)
MSTAEHLNIPVADPPPKTTIARLLRAMWRQRSKTPRCPPTPRLDGQLALVTGGNGGIGFETARGLMRRGASVIIAARNQAKADDAVERLNTEQGGGGAVAWSCRCDLSDLESVAACVPALLERAGEANIDIFVANGGIAPTSHSLSKQGHEAAFATNVLGHFLMTRLLLDAGRLVPARVVVVTGDIYCIATECTPDFAFKGKLGGLKAYARSKLGNVWFARELARRCEGLSVFLVHPGGVATDMVAGHVDRLSAKLLLTAEEGAQMSLICATQPGLERGGYYHNTLGLMKLAHDDPGADRDKASALWSTCEALCRGTCAAS